MKVSSCVLVWRLLIPLSYYFLIHSSLRRAVKSPTLQIFKTGLDTVMSNPIQLWNQPYSKDSSQLELLCDFFMIIGGIGITGEAPALLQDTGINKSVSWRSQVFFQNVTAVGKREWAGIPRARAGKPFTKQLVSDQNTDTIQWRKGTSCTGSTQLEFPFMCLYKQQHRSFSTAFLHSRPSFLKFYFLMKRNKGIAYSSLLREISLRIPSK